MKIYFYNISRHHSGDCGGRSPKRDPTSERSELGGTPRAKRDGLEGKTC